MSVDISLIASLFQQQDYSLLSDISKKCTDIIKCYIRYNPRQYLLTIGFLQSRPDLSDLYTDWMIFQAYERGFVGEDIVCGSDRIFTIDIMKQAGKTVLLNWPELKAARPLLARVYPHTLQFSEDELKRLRQMDTFGDEVIAAITEDSVDKLKKCMAQPGFDIDRQYSLFVSAIHKAIEWESIGCFNFLMLNGASRAGAMSIAVTCGRAEMIELLEQDGQKFQS